MIPPEAMAHTSQIIKFSPKALLEEQEQTFHLLQTIQ